MSKEERTLSFNKIFMKYFFWKDHTFLLVTQILKESRNNSSKSYFVAKPLYDFQKMMEPITVLFKTNLTIIFQ